MRKERRKRRWGSLTNNLINSVETSTLLVFATSSIALALFIICYFRGKELTNRKLKEEALLQVIQSKESYFKKELETIQLELNNSYRTIPVLANQQFEEFKKNEFDSLRAIVAESAKESALADLETWKIQYETFYRQDAINRSQSVILGKVTEHLIPFHKSFPYNPKEARFIGSPIDIIVFKGIENEEDVEIHILEIKTGNSTLNKRQRLIRDAVNHQRVYWRELNI